MPSLNPYQATREEYTQKHCSVELPSDVSPEFKNLFVGNQRLIDALAHHPAMAPNLQQTYMTPAASKNKVYFI